jgi:phosphate transport system permease protein
LIETALLACASLAVFVTAAILYILLSESWAFFKLVSLKEFFTAREWTPLFANPRYGILPLLSGTLLTTLVALLLAIPMGSVIAIYLSEFAKSRVREIVKPIPKLPHHLAL